MHQNPQAEEHFSSSDTLRDIVIGMADGLTVPFALAAGLTGAVESNKIIIVAGFAEIAAGAIAMGLGGYLAARNDAEHYESERRREELEVIDHKDDEVREVLDVLGGYGLTPEQCQPIIKAFEGNHKAWVDWMMRFELGLEEPDPKRAVRSAATIAGSYIFGGMVPLSAYFILPKPTDALMLSAAVTLLALFLFGWVKGRFTGANQWISGVRTMVIGGIAAAAAFAIAKVIV